MIDHLLFNQDKYYPTASNCVIPKHIKILPGAIPGNSDTFVDSDRVTESSVLDCSGMTIKNYQQYGKTVKEIHYLVPYHKIKTTQYPDGYYYDWIKGSDETVIPIY